MGSFLQVPERPSVSPSAYAKLSTEQAGHLRHFHNLLAQLDGDWNHFGHANPHNEFDDRPLFQLATMSYAIAATHYHRVPALRGPLKVLMRRAIHKMMLPAIWEDWYLMSQGTRLTDPDLKELRKPWSDPVVRENIMYSGHLLLMTSLYAMLFDDDEFEQPGSLTFKLRNLSWGLGPQDFVYDNRKLQDVIVKQVEASGWVGVCCEPNAVFVVCNQFPLLAIHQNDVRDGTDLISEILPKYKDAIRRKGMLIEDDLYPTFYAVKQDRVLPAGQGAHTAWANAFMNAWDSPGVRSRFDTQTMGFLTTTPEGKTRLNPTPVAMAFRRLVREEGYAPNDPETLRLACDPSHQAPTRQPFEVPNWGLFTMMLSELGKQKELSDLLQFADEHLKPTWENGGLYYPRCDELMDEEGRLTNVGPHSGNSGIPYSRLNVENGQKLIWEKPWTREIVDERPWIDGITYADGVDFLRCYWDELASAMVVTARLWKPEEKSLSMLVRNLKAGIWATYIDEELTQVEEVGAKGGEVAIKLPLNERETDIVVQQLS